MLFDLINFVDVTIFFGLTVKKKKTFFVNRVFLLQVVMGKMFKDLEAKMAETTRHLDEMNQ